MILLRAMVISHPLLISNVLYAKAIEDAVKFCVEDSTFKKSCLNTSNPYWMGNAGKKIAEKLASVEINQDLIQLYFRKVGYAIK